MQSDIYTQVAEDAGMDNFSNALGILCFPGKLGDKCRAAKTARQEAKKPGAGIDPKLVNELTKPPAAEAGMSGGAKIALWSLAGVALITIGIIVVKAVKK